MTLINNGLATEEDFQLKKEEVEEIAPNRIDLGEEIVSEASKEEEVNDTKEEVKEEVVEEKKKAGRPKKK